MNKTSILIGMSIGSAAILLGVKSAEAIPGDERRGTIGADVAVCDLPNIYRWGTMYNFWFTANRPPAADSGSFTLFRSGNPVTFELITPAGPNNVFDPNGDGCVDVGRSGHVPDLLGHLKPRWRFQ